MASPCTDTFVPLLLCTAMKSPDICINYNIITYFNAAGMVLMLRLVLFQLHICLGYIR